LTLLIYVNGAPVFTVDPFTMPGIVAGQSYSGTIATNASDPNPSDVLTFAKVSGPNWLTVAIDGTLSGAPLSSDIGNDSFVVSVATAYQARPREYRRWLRGGADYFTISLAGNLLLSWSAEIRLTSADDDGYC
jgi:hypothetical protein